MFFDFAFVVIWFLGRNDEASKRVNKQAKKGEGV